jgi:hypothetical protein
MNKKHVLVVIVIIVFGIFVWPGIYQYDKMNQKWPVRINRFTGTTEVLGQNGWSKIGGGTLSEVSQDDLKKMDANIKWTNYGWIEVNLYNGTNLKIKEITINAEFKVDNNVDHTREYKLTGDGIPLSSSKFIVNVGSSPAANETISGTIISAKYDN